MPHKFASCSMTSQNYLSQDETQLNYQPNESNINYQDPLFDKLSETSQEQITKQQLEQVQKNSQCFVNNEVSLSNFLRELKGATSKVNIAKQQYKNKLRMQNKLKNNLTQNISQNLAATTKNQLKLSQFANPTKAKSLGKKLNLRNGHQKSLQMPQLYPKKLADEKLNNQKLQYMKLLSNLEQRKKTFGKFAFKHIEKEENFQLGPILQNLNIGEPKGTMNSSDL